MKMLRDGDAGAGAACRRAVQLVQGTAASAGDLWGWEKGGKAALQGFVGLCIQGSPCGNLSVLTRAPPPCYVTQHLPFPKWGWSVTGETLILRAVVVPAVCLDGFTAGTSTRS